MIMTSRLEIKEREICNFVKANIQYLGHIISGEGITPVPEKLESLEHMPPHNPREVKTVCEVSRLL